MKGFLVVVCLGLSIAAGCNKPAGKETSASAGALSTQPGLPTEAQPRLKLVKLWLGAEELITELALTEQQQKTGMMFRTNLMENGAMLFVFPAPHRASFWMMNTFLPLSAAYIGPDGTILELHDLQPGQTNAVSAASDQVQFVLEVNQGWFGRHGVSTGMLVRAESGPLNQLGRP